jgi:glycosyltransferase involved in cell wall biosynthesis
VTNTHQGLSKANYDDSVKSPFFRGEASRTIAIFLPSLVGGGAERVMLNLAIALSQEGQPVDLVLANAAGPYLDQVPAEINVVDLQRSRTLTSLPALVRYLRKTRPKAIISALDHANLVAIWAKHLAFIPAKAIVTIHSNARYLVHHSSDTRWGIIPVLMRLFFPFAHKIVCVSKGVEDALSETLKLSKENLQTIYNPIISDDIFEKARAPIDHPWFHSDQNVVVAVGRLSQEKGFSTLIQAFSKIGGQYNAKLVILGEGQQRQELELLIQSFGLEDSVQLLGFVDNPYAYLSKATMFVLSSEWEGLPTVLIEALALGIPVISTDCESGPREILNDGEYGILIPINDPERLAEAMLYYLDSPDQSHLENEGRIETVGSYFFHLSAQEYLSLIDE